MRYRELVAGWARVACVISGVSMLCGVVGGGGGVGRRGGGGGGVFFFLMIRRPPRSTLDRSSAASDVYKRQVLERTESTGYVDEPF